MKWSFSKRVWVLLIAAVALTVLLVYLSRRNPPARVSVVQATRGDLVATIPSNGKIEPVAPNPIRAEFDTFVEEVAAVEGQSVRRGQLLLRLNARQVQADLARARQNLVAAEDDLRAARAGGRPDERARIESDLRKAEVDRDRLRRERDALARLIPKRAASTDELDQKEAAVVRAEADVTRLRKALDEFIRGAQLDTQSAALRVEEFRNQVRALEGKARQAQVRSPLDGTLFSLPVKKGDFVRTGDLLADVADLRRVRVRAFIDEPELGELEPGQPVVITWDALPNQSWTGRTEMIPKQVVARGTRSVGELLCAVDNSKLQLLPNTNVGIRVITRERKNVVLVPRGAVETEGPRRFVYLVEGAAVPGVTTKHLRKREVQVGVASATQLEIRSGVREGDVLALPGDITLRDGMDVRTSPSP